MQNLTVITTYPIYPPRGGGQSRVYYLYKNLSQHFNITIISLVHSSLKLSKKNIAQNLLEIQVPKSMTHQNKEEEIKKQTNIAITDIALISLFEYTQEYIEQIVHYATNSKYIISTSPYTYPLIKKYITIPYIYESQNVEYLLKQQMLESTPYNNTLLQSLYDIEKECYINSYITTVCSKQDTIDFQNLYGKKESQLPYIPNGVDLDTVHYYAKNKKNHFKSISKYKDQTLVLFIASNHKPNIDAVYEILKLAQTTLDITYIIVGNVYNSFTSMKNTPSNVIFKGEVNDEAKNHYLAISDVAINPMLSGSGTNLKMLDFIASGIPTISTKVGARGLELLSSMYIESNIDEFSIYLKNTHYYIDTQSAKEFVRANYDWKSIAQNFKHII